MKIEQYAKKTFLALKNPFNTVVRVNPLIIDKVEQSLKDNDYAYYVGTKNTNVIPDSLLENIENKGFLFHTKDVMAYGGRAIDIYLRNPITDRFMSGSSSGTALNVFYGINDIGVGTDGGGSILAPAAALNLYGFISPLIATKHLQQFEKQSTDNITFTPAIGYITRDIMPLFEIIKATLNIETNQKIVAVLLNSNQAENKNIEEIAKQLATNKIQINYQEFPDLTSSRNTLIKFLNSLDKNQIVISLEGPIDLEGIGDSIFGHFDPNTQLTQAKSGKGLMRVVNMSGKSAFVLPTKELGVTRVVICHSDMAMIAQAINIVQMIDIKQSKLIKQYFSNLDMYFE